MKGKETQPVTPKRVDRKLYILIGLIALTGFVVLYQATSGPAERVASLNNVKTTKAVAKSKQPVVSKNPLHTQDPDFLPQLQKEAKEFQNERRNLFAFFTPPPPPAPPPPKPVCGDGMCNGGETYQTCNSDCSPPPPPPVCGDKKCEGAETYASCESDCDPPPPPEISLKYIGFLTDHQGAVAFLTDGKDVFMGRVDDIIANRYRVVKITEEGVELGYVNLKTRQSKTIPFSGSKS
jgi:hypothetical protein